jgi:AraC family transcriptional regulator of adaptative response / DNA-3-methyladenine glycosylase II
LPGEIAQDRQRAVLPNRGGRNRSGVPALPALPAGVFARTPAWAGTSATVTRGLRLIDEGALDTGSVEALSERSASRRAT